MLTAPTWTYNAAGGPNPFIVPARHGFVAAAINTDAGASVVGLGRTAVRFTRSLKLQSRGVAIFAQPAPHHVPEHVYAVGYSTMAGVPPRILVIDREGNVKLDVPRPELAWREGRTVAVTELPHGIVLHLDDRHIVLDARGEVVAEVHRRGSDAPFTIERGMLWTHDGRDLAVVDLVTGETTHRVPLDGRPSALRVDPFRPRLAIRMDRVLLAMRFDESGVRPELRAFVGGLAASPSTHDANLRSTQSPTGGLECLDDEGVPRWSVHSPGATGAFGAGFLTGGELVATASHSAGDRVIIVRESTVLLERPRSGSAAAAGCIARVGERAAVVVAPGAEPGALIEFGATVDVASLRGGGSVVFERPTGPGPGRRVVVVDPAGAVAAELTEGGSGARWAVFSDGLLALPRANAPRVDLFDIGAPA